MTALSPELRAVLAPLLEMIADAIAERVAAKVGQSHEAHKPGWVPIATCGLRPTTARRLVKVGVIGASRVGRELLISTADVDAFVESRRIGQVTDGDELERRLRVVRGA